MTSQTTIRNESAASRRAPSRRIDLIGYAVGVVGGDIGCVDPATADVDPGALVVRTGRWGSRRHARARLMLGGSANATLKAT